ncbi:hypothetical protein LTR86_000026 [Recurvomyces mirabilis]|nr:hypothetical protein LTR86_000026 [Recurvomyces mirabilis]
MVSTLDTMRRRSMTLLLEGLYSVAATLVAHLFAFRSAEFLRLLAPVVLLMAVFGVPACIVHQIVLNIRELIFLGSGAARTMVLHAQTKVRLPAYADYPHRQRTSTTLFFIIHLMIISTAYLTMRIARTSFEPGSGSSAMMQTGYLLLGFFALPTSILIVFATTTVDRYVKRRIHGNADDEISAAEYHLGNFGFEVCASVVTLVQAVICSCLILFDTTGKDVRMARVRSGSAMSVMVTCFVIWLAALAVRNRTEVRIVDAAIRSSKERKFEVLRNEAELVEEKSMV